MTVDGRRPKRVLCVDRQSGELRQLDVAGKGQHTHVPARPVMEKLKLFGDAAVFIHSTAWGLLWKLRAMIVPHLSVAHPGKSVWDLFVFWGFRLISW